MAPKPSKDLYFFQHLRKTKQIKIHKKIFKNPLKSLALRLFLSGSKFFISIFNCSSYKLYSTSLDSLRSCAYVFVCIKYLDLQQFYSSFTFFFISFYFLPLLLICISSVYSRRCLPCWFYPLQIFLPICLPDHFGYVVFLQSGI